MTRSYNDRLEPLPTAAEIVQAVSDLTADRRWFDGVPANVIARQCGVEGARRLGRGAVKGSWSGRMAPGLRLAPRLRQLSAFDGPLLALYDGDAHRHVYVLRNLPEHRGAR